MKKMTALICSLAMMASTSAATLIGHAELEGIALGADGVVYSQEMCVTTPDNTPEIGTVETYDPWLTSAVNLYPDAKYAVEIHPFVQERGFAEEETRYMEEHFLDGKSYAEIKEELLAIDDKERTAEETKKLRYVINETTNYINSLIEAQQKLEADWLCENGIEILDSERVYQHYAVVTKEQLDNFPVSTTTGYKVYLTRADNIPGADLVIESAVSGAMLFGDFNNDGEVNASDAASLLVYSAAVGAGRASEATAADVDGDGNINASDAALILQYSAKAGSGDFVGTLEEYVERIKN